MSIDFTLGICLHVYAFHLLADFSTFLGPKVVKSGVSIALQTIGKAVTQLIKGDGDRTIE